MILCLLLYSLIYFLFLDGHHLLLGQMCYNNTVSNYFTITNFNQVSCFEIVFDLFFDQLIM